MSKERTDTIEGDELPWVKLSKNIVPKEGKSLWLLKPVSSGAKAIKAQRAADMYHEAERFIKDQIALAGSFTWGREITSLSFPFLPEGGVVFP
jgi:hypothetical protein